MARPLTSVASTGGLQPVPRYSGLPSAAPGPISWAYFGSSAVGRCARRSAGRLPGPGRRGAGSSRCGRSLRLAGIAGLIAAGAAGEALRQAERRADEAERTREETARRRADAERLHIARELHDSLTHQISVIKVQSEVAVHVARKRGEQAPEALLAIREAGREAARELRATREALRDDDTTPPPGLGHVPEPVEGAGRGGLAATLTIEGQRHDVPAAVGRTVYRIVQESLTDIARHADATKASVCIAHRADVVALRVDDDGRATPDTAPPPGMGLLVMRERVTALGGRFQAAPRGEGGCTVQAEQPRSRQQACRVTPRVAPE